MKPANVEQSFLAKSFLAWAAVIVRSPPPGSCLQYIKKKAKPDAYQVEADRPEASIFSNGLGHERHMLA
jgi:hypothetical protein